VLAGTLMEGLFLFPGWNYGFNHIRTDYVYRIWYCERFGGLLLGLCPNSELIESINSYFLVGEKIKGTHDLKVHDYGPAE